LFTFTVTHIPIRQLSVPLHQIIRYSVLQFPELFRDGSQSLKESPGTVP